MTKSSLEERFTAFMTSLPFAEEIDKLDFPAHPSKRRKADFLLAKRKVVVELKSLVSDPAHKVAEEADKHRDSDEFPLFFGTADVQKVLKHLPDGQRIYQRIVTSITRSIEGIVRSAEEQITHTRDLLEIPGSAGMLVILNDDVQILDPTVVAHRISQLLRRERTGNSTSEKLNFVWLLFESHALGEHEGRPIVACMLLQGFEHQRFPWFSDFHVDLVRRWAEFNNGVYIEGGSPDPLSLKYSNTKDVGKPDPIELPRQEVWRLHYKQNPYLRNLSDEQVLQHGSQIIDKIAPYFTKNGSTLEIDAVSVLMEQFTHFQEEASFRALDLRKMPKVG